VVRLFDHQLNTFWQFQEQGVVILCYTKMMPLVSFGLKIMMRRCVREALSYDLFIHFFSYLFFSTETMVHFHVGIDMKSE